MKTGYDALIGRIKRILLDLERVVSRAESLMTKAQSSGDDGLYTFNLQMSRLKELTKGLQLCYEAVKRDLDDFMEFLRELSVENSDK